ncbi:undecaprenyldiphospho-muramoylpentapeptide beta-N-acetylglucosaminyltransferase [Pseudoscardovia suis]|uniref:UDP-N-acetylglucosamine--N-acetylmuramyl-(pentapeptide) pyrophosphoryl-undecaprenol N-acetylglucosamine transferase n=1 Tax=Pseudoscardovia suis TaxID=987063 RepID=A0A261F165_9BIFI|nr:undecaprenyldiphospho-muramoylpentapeptide beta-N-acetylglucosaminyltransferase [Pseudoscardovia suis]OZG52815.1 undecaprenyldiphospho-muramoylpentapeptide beta-N-acetylglucosaminyltransferase [Pseudoscardovia suis]PJJ68319.1 UDP-N-acetylglucosamine--N-acetylmuramyl-(pentapeptide) pyrophosphoryl-undecaprenol N-acetylglucosamine transferase [Pseudoscardovia suis]
MSGRRNVHIVLAGGGTAGHVNPLLSIAAAIARRDPQASLSVIGTQVGLESTLVPAAGLPMDTIEKVPFPRKPNGYMFRFPGLWKAETAKVRRILAERQADVVVGVGGYAAAPAYYAAHKVGIPIVIHEQNARAGMANKLGARWASFIGTVYDGTGLKSSAPIRRVGLPLREPIARMAAKLEADRDTTRTSAKIRLGLDPQLPMILVTGGSLGALSLNNAVSQAADTLLDLGQVVHLTGKGKIDAVRSTVATVAGESRICGLGDSSEGSYHATEYWERMDEAFAAADLVICRSGAGTVAEITALGVPAIYVPLPIGNGEQRFNAQPVVDAGGGLLIDDADFTADWVKQHVPALVHDRTRLHAMGKAAWSYGIRDAADAMAQEVLRIASSRVGANA